MVRLTYFNTKTTIIFILNLDYNEDYCNFASSFNERRKIDKSAGALLNALPYGFSSAKIVRRSDLCKFENMKFNERKENADNTEADRRAVARAGFDGEVRECFGVGVGQAYSSACEGPWGPRGR